MIILVEFSAKEVPYPLRPRSSWPFVEKNYFFSKIFQNVLLLYDDLQIVNNMIYKEIWTIQSCWLINHNLPLQGKIWLDMKILAFASYLDSDPFLWPFFRQLVGFGMWMSQLVGHRGGSKIFFWTLLFLGEKSPLEFA